MNSTATPPAIFPLARRHRDAGGRAILSAAVLLATCLVPAAAIDYQPPRFVEQLGLSDLVVGGRVLEVGEEVLRFEIEEVVHGNSPDRILEIVRTDRWPSGDRRRQPYAPGQRFVLFLRAETSLEIVEWRIAGLGGEGELPVNGSWVYLKGRPTTVVDTRLHQVHGIPMEGQRFALDCFLSALRQYGDCFRWQKRLEAGAPHKIERLCDEAGLREYSSHSRLHEFLAAETMRRLARENLE